MFSLWLDEILPFSYLGEYLFCTTKMTLLPTIVISSSHSYCHDASICTSLEHMHMHTCSHAHAHKHTHMYTHTHTQTCTRVHAHTHIQIHAHTCIYTEYTYTDTHTSDLLRHVPSAHTCTHATNFYMLTNG